MSVRVRRGVDDLNHRYRLVFVKFSKTQSAFALDAAPPPLAGVADVGGDAVDVISTTIPFDHDAADFGVRLGLDLLDGDAIWPLDVVPRDVNPVPVVTLNIAKPTERRPVVTMKPAGYVEQNGWAHGCMNRNIVHPKPKASALE
jgi:hypothetical protein